MARKLGSRDKEARKKRIQQVLGKGAIIGAGAGGAIGALRGGYSAYKKTKNPLSALGAGAYLGIDHAIGGAIGGTGAAGIGLLASKKLRQPVPVNKDNKRQS